MDFDTDEIEEEDGHELLDTVIHQKELTRFEGESGTKNLAKLVGMLGYHDPQYFGQFDGGSYGDLLEFFNDNPGAQNAVVEWIYEQIERQSAGDEWFDNLKEAISTEET